MPQDVRIWEIRNGNHLDELKQHTLELEEHIENWIEEDISIVRDDLMIIGRQVETAFGGIIDLLCLDSRGDIVVVEPQL
jgi:RecB family endonuclease NucS